MSKLPAISIVVPVPDGMKPPERTLQSLAEQEYPGLEVIAEHGGSDLAGALDRGFARATGEILGYLSEDRFLLPRILHRVAAEISPDRNRHVVMGGSALVFEPLGSVVEHPAEYLGRFDHLAIWKRGFNPVPQSSVFWHRSVQEGIGNFPRVQPCAIDYDFICRVGRRHEIHKVDELWSACLVDAEVAPAACAETEMLEAWIEVSRTHWGPLLSPLRWRCQASYWLYNRHLHEHARHHAREAEKAAAQGLRSRAVLESFRAWLYSPALARGRFAERYRRALLRKSR